MLKEIRPAHVQQFVNYLQGDVRQKQDGTLDAENPKISQATVRRKLTVLLGHSEWNTTNKYLHLVQEADVQAACVLDTMLTITKTDNLQLVREA